MSKPKKIHYAAEDSISPLCGRGGKEWKLAMGQGGCTCKRCIRLYYAAMGIRKAVA